MFGNAIGLFVSHLLFSIAFCMVTTIFCCMCLFFNKRLFTVQNIIKPILQSDSLHVFLGSRTHIHGENDDSTELLFRPSSDWCLSNIEKVEVICNRRFIKPLSKTTVNTQAWIWPVITVSLWRFSCCHSHSCTKEEGSKGLFMIRVREVYSRWKHIQGLSESAQCGEKWRHCQSPRKHNFQLCDLLQSKKMYQKIPLIHCKETQRQLWPVKRKCVFPIAKIIIEIWKQMHCIFCSYGLLSWSEITVSPMIFPCIYPMSFFYIERLEYTALIIC